MSITETVVAVANDDEVNILASLLSKKEGAHRAIALMNNPVYWSLVGTLGIDVALDPRETTVSSIIRHVRRGRIRDLHSICNGQAEIIEAEVLEASEVAGKKISDLRLHGTAKFGLIVRGDEILVPVSNTVLEPEDRVIILSLSEAVGKIEQLFSARADIF